MARIAIVIIISLLSFSQPALGRLEKMKRLTYINLNAYSDIKDLEGLSASLNIVLGIRHEVGLGYYAYMQQSRNYPSDFICGLCKHGLANDITQGVAATHGYLIYPTIFQGFGRLALRAGVLVGTQNRPVNFQKLSNPGSNDDNYTYDYESRPVVALLLRPSLDINFGQTPGITIGPYAVISKDFTNGGVSIGLMLGKVGHTVLRAKKRQEILERKLRESEMKR